MDHLDRLENTSIHILREAYSAFDRLCMLWSIGKDSTVLLWLTRKAFFGHVPIPLVHIDTSFKIPEMIRYRDQLVQEWNLDLRVAGNDAALAAKRTFPDGELDRIQCCQQLKTAPLRAFLEGSGESLIYCHERKAYRKDREHAAFQGAIVGLRADEEGTRSKERYFSPRDQSNAWNIATQPPEFWNQFNTEYPKKTHVRVHPLLDWTELNVWEYIEREKIPTVSLYYDQGEGTRYRSLGCAPCTKPVQSTAKNPAEIIAELRSGQFSRVAERSGRAQDKDGGGGLEVLRKDGYM